MEGFGGRPWADPAALAANRLPVRPAGMVPFPDLVSARTHRPAESEWFCPLDGEWDFELLDRPEDVSAEHLVVGARGVAGGAGDRVEVPGAWTMQGHGSPIYTNVAMPFGGEPPSVPADNPTAVYRRRVSIPKGWRNRRVVLKVGSAESMLFVYLDGEPVGFSTDSRLAAEFDLTDLCRAGSSHELALVVPRWSASSWIEDQDQWWQGGLQRSVSLHSTAAAHLATAALVPGLDHDGIARDGCVGTLSVDVSVGGPPRAAPGWTVEVHVETLRGRALASTGPMVVPHWDSSSVIAQAAGAMLTEPGRVRGELRIDDVVPWSAESPNRYRSVVTLRDPDGQVVEVGALRVGFRSVTVEGRQLLLNGAPVVLRGVNLHEHDPGRGRAVSPADLRGDLELVKGANLNAVRAAHYPHDECFAELCDELGLYLVDEANVESHARQWSLCHEGTFDAAIVERVTRMAQRDMHHPSVVIWSLGNESGYGPAHDAAAATLRRIDPSRPVQYEGPFMYDLDAGAPVSDVVCPMYSTVPEITAWAERGADPRRPLILCEYSHAMGNACGGLSDYDEAFETVEGLQGGFIWEWCEHGIPTRDGARGPDGAPSWGYAGDFGDDPEEGNFVLDGLVGADRRAHPVLDEVRYLGRPVRAALVASDEGRARVSLHNTRWFTDTSDLRCEWELSLDGEVIQRSELTNRPLAPRESREAVLRWRRDLLLAADPERLGEVHLTMRWFPARKLPWAGTAEPLGWDQFELRAAPEPAGVVANGSSGAARTQGSADPLDRIATEGVPAVFRALTDNDGISRGWMRGMAGSLSRWIDSQGLDRCTWNPAAGELQPAGDVPPVRCSSGWSALAGGWNLLRVDFDVPEELDDPPRLGITWELPGELEHLEFFAEGPADNYPDRRAAALLGQWRSTVSDQYVDYGMPQEHAHHGSLRWLALRTSPRGPGLMFVALGASLADRAVRPGFSARHHGDSELWAAAHTADLDGLADAPHTHLSIDVAQRGLGQSSLGPETDHAHRIPAGRAQLSLLVRALASGSRAGGQYRAARDGLRGPRPLP